MKIGTIEIHGPNIHSWMALILFTAWSVAAGSWWPIIGFVGATCVFGLIALLVVRLIHRNGEVR